MFDKSARSTFFCFLSLMAVFNCNAAVETLKGSDGAETKIRVDWMPASFFRKPAQTVLIGHGSGGVTANHAYWAKTVNGWGYNAVVIDHYTLRGITRHTGQVAISTIDRARDFGLVSSWVQKQPWHQGKMAIVGFSQGGSGLMSYVNEKVMTQLEVLPAGPTPVAAVIAIYPGCGIQSPPDKPSMPVLMLLAEKDDLAPAELCKPVDDPLYKVKVLKNATHSFDEKIPSTVKLIFTQRYSQDSVDEARDSLQEFLGQHLK